MAPWLNFKVFTVDERKFINWDTKPEDYAVKCYS